MPGLKITLLQQPLVWMDGPANLRHFDRQLEGITGRDVIVLPEMFTSGFAMEAAASSLAQDDVVNWMTAKAQQCNALIAGSVALQSRQCASDCGMARLAYFAAGVLRLTFSCVVAQSQRL